MSAEQPDDLSKWGKFPRWWAIRLRGHSNAMMVAVFLSSCVDRSTGEAWPSLKTMAQFLGIHRSRVAQSIAILKRVGIISSVTRQRRSSARYKLAYEVPDPGTSCDLQDIPDSSIQEVPDSDLNPVLEVPDPRHSITPHGYHTTDHTSVFFQRGRELEPGERLTQLLISLGRPDPENNMRRIAKRIGVSNLSGLCNEIESLRHKRNVRDPVAVALAAYSAKAKRSPHGFTSVRDAFSRSRLAFEGLPRD